ncbi:hypothetical protein [Streptomyces sp. BK340]|uniref:hypothetical protein n=1 Tax=Streptomyces sp. BK340 TaxID=2572903 RepID=UPI0011A75006|nr:hypothetical protein [Streptomyces sp. BK340]TVZ77339.1 hypothetical protein FB157_13974 [Streptomyces sp. BK340]
MTNIDMTKPDAAIDTDTRTLEAATGVGVLHHKGTKKDQGARNKGTKNKTKRRLAKALAYFALIFSGLLVLAEPWLLIPVVALVLAVSFWD